MEKTLTNIYYKPSKVGSLGGVKPLVNASGNSLKDIKEWIIGQRTYSLHKPARRRMTQYRKYRVPIFGYQIQMDLNDMIKYAPENKGYKYILTAIDLFSRFSWAFPLKSKSGLDVLKAIKQINVIPYYIQVDQGTEFYNSIVKNYLNRKGVKLFSVYSPQKAAIVERFNRTLKTRMFRYFTHHNNHKWVDILPQLVDSYNNSIHRSIKMSPIEARKTKNWWIVWELANKIQQKKRKIVLKIGDHVRLSKVKRLFEKGYETNWTEQIYTISKIDKSDVPIMYEIKNYKGEIISGKFYSEELQRVIPPNRYPIEKIIKRRKNNFLVKFLGYPEYYWTKTIETSL